jgi:RimJ/RimL family protein N-acetyltransferase
MTFPPLPDIPDEIRTARLWLRRPKEADASALMAARDPSLPELRRWMVWAQSPQDLEATRQNLRAAAAAFASREGLRYHVWNEAGTEIVGSSGYHALDWRVPKGEIGYWIATPHTGQGYAREVTAALTEVGLEKLHFRRLEIRCDAANERSARIPAALGYTFDARLVNDAVAADHPLQLRDTLVFSRVR